MTQPKLTRERIKRVEELQIFATDYLSDNDHSYIQETNELIQDLFDVTNGWDMSGHSYIDEVCIRDSLYVSVIWGDGEHGNCSFPASILDADDPVKAARVDYLKKQVIKANADIRMANYTISTRMEAVVRYQEELVKLTGSSNG